MPPKKSSPKKTDASATDADATRGATPSSANVTTPAKTFIRMINNKSENNIGDSWPDDITNELLIIMMFTLSST